MNGLIALVLAQAATAQAPPAVAPPLPRACDKPEYAAFDFWVGDWDVYPAGKDTPIARSRIEKLYGGCAVRENWMPFKGGGGGSLNGYNPRTREWRQTWIGSSPGPVEFSGGPVSDEMVLVGFWAGSGPNGEDGMTRMTYSRLESGSVRQHGEFSGDHGLTWQTTFDLIYRPHKD